MKLEQRRDKKRTTLTRRSVCAVVLLVRVLRSQSKAPSLIHVEKSKSSHEHEDKML